MPDKPTAYTAVNYFSRLLLRIFFRRVEVTGLEHLPATGGGVLVSWHPNGLIDPGLVFACCPRSVIFGARHGLFQVPLLGLMMKAIGTVPIHRAQDTGADPEARKRANRQALDALAQRVVEGNFSCLFPEGDSHDAPHLLPLKDGAAWFYYAARQRNPPDAPRPVIIPVGLHYDHKRAFRSSTLVAFHPPIPLDPELDLLPGPNEPEEQLKERVKRLTGVIEDALHNVVHATEDWELHFLMHRARKLVRAERADRAGQDLGPPDMEERLLGFARIWTGYYALLETHPEEVAMLRHRLAEYDADLEALGIEDHELSRDPRLMRPAISLALQVFLVFFILPPVLLVGGIVNLPAALLLWGVSKLAAKRKKDEATIKLLGGAILFPLVWVLAGAFAWQAHSFAQAWFPTLPDSPWPAVGALIASGVISGFFTLQYLRLIRETLRGLRVRLTRARRQNTVNRLRKERSELYEAITGLARGLDLPGHVTAEGRVVAEEEGPY